MSQSKLTECLRLFNRKESDCLVRNAFSPRKTKKDPLNLPLSALFLEDVLKAAKIKPTPPLKEVWWAMEYHLDWFFGALTYYMEQPEKRPEIKKFKGIQKLSVLDVDFAISFENSSKNYLIFIEAKMFPPTGKDHKEKIICKILKARDLKNLTNDTVDIRFLLLFPEADDADDTVVAKLVNGIKEELKPELPCPDYIPLGLIKLHPNNELYLKNQRGEENGEYRWRVGELTRSPK